MLVKSYKWNFKLRPLVFENKFEIGLLLGGTGEIVSSNKYTKTVIGMSVPFSLVYDNDAFINTLQNLLNVVLRKYK